MFISFMTQSEKYWALKTKSTKMDNQNFLILVIKVGVTYPKIWFKTENSINTSLIHDSTIGKISSFLFDQNALKLSEEINKKYSLFSITNTFFEN